MPNTLKLVIAIMFLGAALNVLGGSLLTGALVGAAAFGVLVGNDGIRLLLRAVSALQIGVVAITGLLPLLGITDGDGSSGPMMALTLALGLATPAYLFWALGQDEVREWMVRRLSRAGC